MRSAAQEMGSDSTMGELILRGKATVSWSPGIMSRIGPLSHPALEDGVISWSYQV